jgi:hypothetical protein
MHELYRRWIDELWGGDLAVAEEIVAEDFAGHWPDREVSGREELVAMIRETREMFTELRLSIEVGPIAERDLLAGRWVGGGRTAEGEMRLFGNDLLRVEGGRLAEYWVASWAG